MKKIEVVCAECAKKFKTADFVEKFIPAYGAWYHCIETQCPQCGVKIERKVKV